MQILYRNVCLVYFIYEMHFSQSEDDTVTYHSHAALWISICYCTEAQQSEKCAIWKLPYCMNKWSLLKRNKRKVRTYHPYTQLSWKVEVRESRQEASCIYKAPSIGRGTLHIFLFLKKIKNVLPILQ